MTQIPEIATWWAALNADVKAALAAEPGKALTGEEVVELVRVRGVGPTGTRWVGTPSDTEFRLTWDEQQWIERNAGEAMRPL